MKSENNERIEDLMLGGLKIIQNSSLYSFTSDSVLLSKFATAKVNDKVADFCSGSGIVGLHFYALNPKIKSVDLFEIQSGLAEMSERTVKLNGLEEKFTVHNQPIQEIGNEFNEYFSIILCNPPYKKKNSGETNLSISDKIARHEEKVTLKEIIETARRKLKFSGRLVICNKSERLAETFSYLKDNGFEPKRLQFVAANSVKPPYLFILEATKGGASGLKIEPQLINTYNANESGQTE